MRGHVSRGSFGLTSSAWPIVFLLLGSMATADVVRPPPARCPRGHTPATSHGGAYCRPPPPRSCPAGHVPRVVERTAYCEPPPKEPCLPGSDWTSQSLQDTYCLAQASCAEGSCGDGATCVPTSFCLTWTCFRCSMSRIVGTCKTSADCPKGVSCFREYRCDPKKKRAPVKPSRATQPLADAKLGTLPKHEPADCGYQSCPAGLQCVPLSLCLEGADSSTERRPGTTPVVGSCSGGARCPGKSVCSRRFRCVDPKLLKPAGIAPRGTP